MSDKTNKDVISFPIPLEFHMPPTRKPVTTTITNNASDLKERYELIRKQCRIEGFDVGAVVSLRFVSGYKPALHVGNWGIVIRMNHYHADPEMFRPLVVRWINANNKQVQEFSYDVDQLFLIHRSHEKDDLELSLMEQEEAYEMTRTLNESV